MPNDVAPNGAPASVSDSSDLLEEGRVHHHQTAGLNNVEDNTQDDQLPALVVGNDIVPDLLPSMDHGTDTGENDFQIRSNASAVQFPFLRKGVFNKDKKAGLIDVRANQAVLHLSHTQVRIEALEKAIKEMHDDFYNKPKIEPFDPQNAKKHQAHKPELRRSTWANFKVGKQTYDVPTEFLPALETLYLHSTYNTTTGSKCTSFLVYFYTTI